jgi:hypothetical protein
MKKPIVFDANMQPFAELSAEEKLERLLAYAPNNVAMFKEGFNFLSEADTPQAQFTDALEAAYGNPLQACEEAIRLAWQHGFLDQLAQRIALAPGPEARERIWGFGGRGIIAIAQGVFDADNGLTDTRVLFGLCEVNRAICVVLNGQQAVGTGILVENDLVLTAAHVFEDNGFVADGTRDQDLIPLIDFEFYGPEGSLVQTARLARPWRVAYAQSCIRRTVNGAMPADAGSSLDYMLVRLDRAITGNIAPLSLTNIGRIPPESMSARERNRRYYIVGYPGGRSAKFAFGNVLGIDPEAARILHKCDSTNGMSGSPLLDDSARIIALHEGRIEDAQGTLLHNRATLLRAISAAIEAARRKAEPAPAFISSAGVRRLWAEYGSMAGSPQHRARWRRVLKSAGVGEHGESLDGTSDNYYPIFHFGDLQTWLDLPVAGLGASRVLCVEGNAGHGKTFTLQYAQTRAGSESTHLVSAGISSASSLPDMLASLYPGGTVEDTTRPADGRLRRHAESALDYFEKLAAHGSGKQLLIVVDLDPSGAYWEDTYRFWREFALLCSARRTLRLLLCGPSANFRNELNMHGINRIVCPEVELEAVKRHCRAVAEQLDMPDRADWAQGRASELWNEERPGSLDRRYATCDAARIVIQVRQELIEIGETDGQHG